MRDSVIVSGQLLHYSPATYFLHKDEGYFLRVLLEAHANKLVSFFHTIFLLLTPRTGKQESFITHVEEGLWYNPVDVENSNRMPSTRTLYPLRPRGTDITHVFKSALKLLIL